MLSNDAEVWPPDTVAVVGRLTVVSATADGFAIGDETHGSLAEALATTAIGDGDPVDVVLPEASPISVESFVDLVATIPSRYPRQQSSLDEPALTVNGQRFHAIVLKRPGVPVSNVFKSDEPWAFVPDDDLDQSLGWASISEEGAMISGTWQSSVTLLPSGDIVIEEREDDSPSERYLFMMSGNFGRVSAVREWFSWLDPLRVGLIESAVKSASELAATRDAGDWVTDTLRIEAHLELTHDEEKELWDD